MTSEGLGEMFEGDSADMYAEKFPLMLMGGRANGQACADGERGPPWREQKFLNLQANIQTFYIEALGIQTFLQNNINNNCLKGAEIQTFF